MSIGIYKFSWFLVKARYRVADYYWRFSARFSCNFNFSDDMHAMHGCKDRSSQPISPANPGLFQGLATNVLVAPAVQQLLQSAAIQLLRAQPRHQPHNQELA
jgi:hypothetical protein